VNFGQKPLVARLRAGVWTRIKSSKDLVKEYRRTKGRPRWIAYVVNFWLACLGGFGVLSIVARLPSSRAFSLLFLVLISNVMVRILHGNFRSRWVHLASSGWPFSDQQMMASAERSILKSFLWCTLILVAAFSGWAFWIGKLDWAKALIGAGMGAFQGVLILALAYLTMASNPFSRVYGLVQKYFSICGWSLLGFQLIWGILVYVAKEFFRRHLPPSLIDEIPAWVYLLLPTGWNGLVLRDQILQQNGTWMWLLAGTALVICTIQWSRVRLRQSFTMLHLEIEEMIDARSHEDEFYDGIESTRPGVEPTHEQVRESIAVVIRHDTPLLDRLVVRCLNPRERLLFELATQSSVSWAKRLRIAFFCLVVGVAAGLLTQNTEWKLLTCGALSAAFALPLLGGGWPGLRPAWIGYHTSAPLFDAYPITYREMAWMMLKTNALRIALWSPLWVAYVAFGSHRLGIPVEIMFRISLLPLVVLAVQPAIMSLSIYPSQRHVGRSGWWVRALGMGSSMVLFLWMAACAVAVFLLPWPWTLLGMVMVVAPSLFCFYTASGLYVKGYYDLLQTNPEEF